MGLISTIKSLLGVSEGERARSTDAGTPVSVEREPEAAAERAVKGVDEGPSSDGGGTAAAEAPSARGSGEEAPDVDGEPVDAIKGIGAAYADRLADAGVHTVEDLAAADADALAAETDLGAGRLATWIARARAMTR